MQVRDLIELKDEIGRRKLERERLLGQLEGAKAKLKTDFGLNSVEAAKRRVDFYADKADKIRAKIQVKLDELKAKYERE